MRLKLDITFTKIFLASTLHILLTSDCQRRYLITASEAQLITWLLCRVRLVPPPVPWVTPCFELPLPTIVMISTHESMMVWSSPIRWKAGRLHSLCFSSSSSMPSLKLWIGVLLIEIPSEYLSLLCKMIIPYLDIVDHLRLQSPWYVEFLVYQYYCSALRWANTG